MSLINDVLKDLERRNAAPGSPPPTPSAGRPARPRRSWTWAVLGLAAVATGVILHLSLRPPGNVDTGRSGQVLTAQADVSAEAVRQTPDSATAPDRADTNRTRAAAAVHSSNRALVSNAAADREAAPADRTAMPAEAPSGRSRGEQETSPRESAPETTPSPRPAPVPEPQPAADATDENQTNEAPQATITIERAGAPQDETDPLVAARRMIAQGRYGRAEARLRTLIAEQPERADAYELLARTLIRRGRSQQAVGVLEEGLSRADRPSVPAAFLARLLIERGEVSRAARILADHAPAMRADTDYHLLLAATYRHAGNHERAAEHYRELTDHLPYRGTAWVGLGASLEALDRTGEALDAYRQALEADDDRAAAFARSRLRALETTTGVDP